MVNRMIRECQISNLQYQAENHPSIQTDDFQTIEQYCSHLFYLKAYEEASLLTPGKKVLDLGCNNGWGSRILSQNADCVVGADVSSRAITEARQKYPQKNLEFLIYDGFQVPVQDNSFDVITSFQVLEHVENHEAYFNLIKKCLKKDGIVLLSTPNASTRLNPGMKPWNKLHVREFNSSELREQLMKYFSFVEIRGIVAEDPVNTIEFSRVQKELAKALHKKMKPKQSFFMFVYGKVKSAIVYRLFKNRILKTSEKSSNFKNETQNFTTQILYLSSDNIEKALHLYATCRM